MKIYRMAYVMVLLGAVLFSMLYTSTLASLILTAFIVIPFLSLIIGFIGSFTVKSRPLLLKLASEKETPYEYILLVENNSLLPVSPLRITGTFPDEKKQTIEKKQLVITLSPFKKMKICFNGILKYRGIYEVTLDTIEFFDILHIFRFKRKLCLKSEIRIYPRRIELDNASYNEHSDDSDRTLPKRGNDKTDFSSVREYKEGDLMQSVHWKLSAKQNELMVKQYEQNVKNSVVLLSDYSCRYVGDERRLAHDSIIEATLAISMFFVKKERPLTISANSGKLATENYSLSGLNDVDMLFEQLTVLNVSDNPYGFGMLVNDAMLDKSFDSSVCIITSDLTAEKLSDIRQNVLSRVKSVSLIILELYPTEAELLNEAACICSSIEAVSAYNLPSELKTIFFD